MLKDYDAKGVASVMGVAFLRAPTPPEALAGSSDPITGATTWSRPPQESSLLNLLAADVGVVQGWTFPGDGCSFPVGNAVVTTVDAGNLSGFSVAVTTTMAGSVVATPSPVLIERAVEQGLPRQALRHVTEMLAGGNKAIVASLEQEVVPRSTLGRRQSQLSPQESERTERVARLFVHARTALGTEDEAREFMTTPHPQLDGRTPFDATKTDLGTRRVEQILNALEYGLAV